MARNTIDTIDDVLAALDAIVDRAWSEGSRLGYFAVLYRRVTRRVKQGLAAGEFPNGPLLERLDVVFARRYLDAVNQLWSGQPPSACWQVAFRALGDREPLILQHLLGGMNAHINYDLGIASADTIADVSSGDQLPALKPDFDQINALLAEEVGGVEQELAAVSPAIGLLEKVGLRSETKIINFSITAARDLAWSTAQRVAAAPAAQRGALCGVLDAGVAVLGHGFVHPPLLVAAELLPIRVLESDDVRHVLEVLAGGQLAAAAAAGPSAAS
ncbi:MAG TPA: DUF5995 family protein [Terriglobales bacterium]|nr:DUF5995 family protein [Terriglobales bacterium]